MDGKSDQSMLNDEPVNLMTDKKLLDIVKDVC
jgi:hypothetical protein